jgi:threonine dehydratase
LDRGETLADYGVNAVWLGSGSLTAERIAILRDQGARVFAEFNTMHHAAYLAEHPDAAPIGVNGKVCPPPDGWQGVCPTHPGYRADRMAAFRRTLEEFEIDGIWLDYHHSLASWEQAEPNLPDTCFCPRCLEQFARATGIADVPGAACAAAIILNDYREQWTDWRCGVFTDWVREFRKIVDAVRPGALLGTFHCPWSDTERDAALRNKLAIDLRAQAKYIDVFSIMPYHARFGHAGDPAWILRQIEWLGRHLGISGAWDERKKIWPIVQIADWGERVPADQVATVLDHGTYLPATGVMVFAWHGLQGQVEKQQAIGRMYRSMIAKPRDVIGSKMTSPIRPTTFIEMPRLASRLGLAELTLASETFQWTGSFKFRAAYEVASNVEQKLLIAASSGNFGQALAYACFLLSKQCIIVMPGTSAAVKMQAVVEYGGKIDLIDVTKISRSDRVAQLAAEHPDAYIASAYDDPLVIRGNASLGREIAAMPMLPEMIVAPVGGGGLTSGIVTGLGNAGKMIQVIGAEPLMGNDAARSLRQGRLVSNESEPQTIADGARTVSLGKHNWAILQHGLAGIVEVPEDQIIAGVRALFSAANLKAEPTGALSLGAILHSPGFFKGRRVCCVVSGGNVDPALYARLIG